MSFMNKLSQNKVKLLLVTIVLIVVILMISMVIFFQDNSANPGYGNRLDGIEDVEITKDQSKKMVSTIKKENKVKSVTYNIQGKIVNVIITVEKGTALKDAKALATKVTDCYKKEQVSFYDFQIFVKNEDEKNKSYPIIGYKKATSDSFSFTKNRGEK